MADLKPLKKFQTKEDIEEDFIASGEMDRFREIVTKRLYESGWTLKVEELARDLIDKKGTEHCDVQTIVAEVTPAARKIVPEEVKRELMDLIKNFVNERSSDTVEIQPGK